MGARDIAIWCRRAFTASLIAACLFAITGVMVLCIPSTANADDSSQLVIADPVYATADEVAEMIRQLPVDPREFAVGDLDRVTAIQIAFESLSEADQAEVDKSETHPKTSQPLGRVLEAALWSVWSYNEVDNSTALPNGVYDKSTTPALSSEYSKGKSTSGRQKPWSVKSVEVKDGKAYATVAVESDTYSGVWKGGVVFPKTNSSGNCEFANVPIDLNSTFYFAGISTTMPAPIAFSLTTIIDESAAPETPLEKAKRLIAALPGDPDMITDQHRGAIEEATAAYEALTAGEQSLLDATECDKDQSYGRWLESAQWGLMALQPLSNSTKLVDGDYSDVVMSSSTMGKSESERGRSWSVVRLLISDGKAIATISCRQKSAFRKMRVGGKDYTATVDSAGIPYFEVPLPLNETVAFTVDFNDKADSIAYQLTNAVPSVAATTERVKEAAAFAQKTIEQGVARYTTATGTAIMRAAENLKSAAEKKDVTYAELSAASKLLNDALAAAEDKPADDPSDSTKPDSGSDTKPAPSDGGSGGNSDGGGTKPNGQGGSTNPSKQPSSTTPTSQGGKTAIVPSTNSTTTSSGGKSVSIPSASTTQSNKSTTSAQTQKSNASASKESASKTTGSTDKNKQGDKSSAEQAANVAALNREGLESIEKANQLSGVMVGAGFVALLLMGMCLRAFQFVRNRG